MTRCLQCIGTACYAEHCIRIIEWSLPSVCLSINVP